MENEIHNFLLYGALIATIVVAYRLIALRVAERSLCTFAYVTEQIVHHGPNDMASSDKDMLKWLLKHNGSGRFLLFLVVATPCVFFGNFLDVYRIKARKFDLEKTNDVLVCFAMDNFIKGQFILHPLLTTLLVIESIFLIVFASAARRAVLTFTQVVISKEYRKETQVVLPPGAICH